jgi:hypothetical protein
VLAGSTDSHPRQLGKVLALAFADERTERQMLIDRYIREDDGANLSDLRQATPRVTLAPVKESLAPEPQAEAAVPAAMPAAAPRSAPFWRHAATTAGMVAATLVGVLVGGWRVEAARREPAARTEMHGRDTAPSAPAPLADPTPSEGARAPDRSDRSAVAVTQPEKRRHHRRPRIAHDEDGTLPPSLDVDDR